MQTTTSAALSQTVSGGLHDGEPAAGGCCSASSSFSKRWLTYSPGSRSTGIGA
jgi:hypothetical protein